MLLQLNVGNRRLRRSIGLERVTGIEPVYSAWKAAALPLSYTRIFRSEDEWWRELDLNQRRLSQRIYSPSPLTTRASLQLSVRIVTLQTGEAFEAPRDLGRVYDGQAHRCQHAVFRKFGKKFHTPHRAISRRPYAPLTGLAIRTP